MPFIAIDKRTKERVDITQYEAPKKELAGRDFICQVCETPMMVKHGLVVVAHFAHYPDYERDCLYGGESATHLWAKRAIANRLGGNGERYKAIYDGSTIDYEVYLEEINRIADVLVTFPDGTREAHEIQLSAITGTELEQRTRDYLSAGIDVFWWLGHNANTDANRDWIAKEFGYFAYVEPSAVQII